MSVSAQAQPYAVAPTYAAAPTYATAPGVSYAPANYATAPAYAAPVGTYSGAQMTYAPAAATVAGYQQYTQYAHSPQYHGAQLTQAQYITADTNHDGMVSQVELQAAQPVAAQAGQSFIYAPATATGYQQYTQYAHSPQYHGAQLTQAQYLQADANHDGRVSVAEIEAAQHAPVYHQPAVQPAAVYHQPAAQLPTAASMVAYPQYAPQYQQYQSQFQFSAQPQLTAQEFAQADTNHDGRVSTQEITTELAAVGKDSKPSKKKVSKKKKKGGCC